MNFLEWLRRVVTPRITCHFHGPVTFNLFAGKRIGKLGKGRPKLLATAQPQAQRLPLVIRLGPTRRELQLAQPPDSRIRESWAATMKDLRQPSKHI